MVEACNVVPQNYNHDIFSKYKKIYTWNSKVYNDLKTDIDIVKVNGFPLFDNHYNLDSFIPIEEKQGLCLICRHRETDIEWDISPTRLEMMMRINYPIKHCYGKVAYGGDMYKGLIGNDRTEQSPSSLEKLKLLNKYKFNLCFENCYHHCWSWDYITEKITDCFKAKTIPIYWGCYNIEDHIPKELFIDFREWINDISGLSNYLLKFDNKQYKNMIENAYDFVNSWRWGNIEDLRKVFDNEEK
jgi:hypothetical protein